MSARCENTRETGRWRESRLSEALCQTHTAHAAVGRQRDGPRSGKCRWALCDVRWKFSVYDCFARGVSRVRASCTVPRLQVRLLASNNEDLNSLNSLNRQETKRQLAPSMWHRRPGIVNFGIGRLEGAAPTKQEARRGPARGLCAVQAACAHWVCAGSVLSARRSGCEARTAHQTRPTRRACRRPRGSS